MIKINKHRAVNQKKEKCYSYIFIALHRQKLIFEVVKKYLLLCVLYTLFLEN